MSYLEYNVKRSPSGFRKVLHVNWALVLLLTAVASIGFLQLYSVSGGNFERWTEPQMQRFALALAVMFAVGFAAGLLADCHAGAAGFLHPGGNQ